MALPTLESRMIHIAGFERDQLLRLCRLEKRRSMIDPMREPLGGVVGRDRRQEDAAPEEDGCRNASR